MRTRLRPPRTESVILCLLSFLLSLAIGYILVFREHVVIDDAVSRVMNAYFVFFRGTLHFGAIGFIWNPFPSLLELPIAAFHMFWAPLITVGFASNIASSLFSMVSVYYLHRILYRFHFGRLSRILWCLLFLLNPMILYYNANGMSDGMLLGCLLATLSGILTYLEDGRLEALAVGAMWLAVAFMFRYEALPFYVFTAGAVVLALWRMRQPRQETQAMLVLYAMPMAYAIIAWMFLNWLIMKNPLYFLISPYGNASQINTGSYASVTLAAANHDIWNSLSLSMQFTLLFFPCIIGVIWAFVQQFRFRPDPRWIVLLASILAMPLFQAAMIYLNASAAWSRFFIYYIPFGVCLLGLMVATSHRRLRTYMIVVVTTLFVLGDVGTFRAMHSPVIGNPEWGVLWSIENHKPYRTFDEEVAVSQYINSHPNIVVLTDTFDTSDIIARLRRPAQCVITSDVDFQSMLENPRGRVDSILVAEPSGISKLNAINQTYPNLWQGGVPWTRLICEFPGSHHYRLYAVTSSAP